MIVKGSQNILQHFRRAHRGIIIKSRGEGAERQSAFFLPLCFRQSSLAESFSAKLNRLGLPASMGRSFDPVFGLLIPKTLKTELDLELGLHSDLRDLVYRTESDWDKERSKRLPVLLLAPTPLA